MDEIEQLLANEDMDLRRSCEEQKAIIRGDFKLEQIEQKFADKEKQLEKLYEQSNLPYTPRREELKALLMNCLEHHYGSLANAVNSNKQQLALAQISKIAQENL